MPQFGSKIPLQYCTYILCQIEIVNVSRSPFFLEAAQHELLLTNPAAHENLLKGQEAFQPTYNTHETMNAKIIDFLDNFDLVHCDLVIFVGIITFDNIF